MANKDTIDLEPRTSKAGHICDWPILRMGVRARSLDGNIAYPRFPFILDTGSDISLIPATVVRQKRLVFVPHERQIRSRPITLSGPMAEGEWGSVYILYLDRILELPSFMYEPPAHAQTTPEEVNGPPGQKRIDRTVQTTDEWIAQYEKTEGEEEQKYERIEFVLGRAEFLDKHSVLIQNRRITVSTEKLRLR